MFRHMKDVDLYSLQPGDEFVEDYNLSEVFTATEYIVDPNTGYRVLIGISPQRTVRFGYMVGYSHYGPNLQKLVYTQGKEVEW